MISTLTGTVLETRIDGLVINIGGLGLFAICAPETIAAAQVGEVFTVQTTLVVREDSLTLFGFADAHDRELFEIVQAVSGFGPKLAFTIVATLPGDQLRSAILTEDVVRLTKTPGVGSKGAARLILELKDKVGPVARESRVVTNNWANQVEQGLTGLGWSAKEAQRAISLLPKEIQNDPADVAAILRAALQILANQ